MYSFFLSSLGTVVSSGPGGRSVLGTGDRLRNPEISPSGESEVFPPASALPLEGLTPSQTSGAL